MVCKPCADFTLGLYHPGQVSLSLSLARSRSSRTPQTPLKHYPRADALGKSDATIQLPQRIDITSHHGRPRMRLHTCIYIYIYICIYVYMCMYTRIHARTNSNLHSVAGCTRDRPSGFQFSKRVESRPRKHHGMYIR